MGVAQAQLISHTGRQSSTTQGWLFRAIILGEPGPSDKQMHPIWLLFKPQTSGMMNLILVLSNRSAEALPPQGIRPCYAWRFLPQWPGEPVAGPPLEGAGARPLCSPGSTWWRRTATQPASAPGCPESPGR